MPHKFCTTSPSRICTPTNTATLQAHEAFKSLVDKLLTEFLEELGVSLEMFYGQVSKAQDADRLTSFVVQTILTVDDFLMFKSMMVQRNLDFTNQVRHVYVIDGKSREQGVVEAGHAL